jgi:hypothetical protein
MFNTTNKGRQSTTTRRYLLIPVMIISIKKINVGDDGEKLEPLHTVGGNAK